MLCLKRFNCYFGVFINNIIRKLEGSVKRGLDRMECPTMGMENKKAGAI